MSSFFSSAVSPVLGLVGLVKDTLTPDKPNLTNPANTPPPVIEDTQAKMQDTADALRRRKGRASAILTRRDQAAPTTASKQLLGQ